MQVTLLRDMEGVAALRDKWQPLLDRSQPNHVFMTWEWLFTWWRHFGAGHKLFVLAVEDDGEIIGILPLMLSTDDRGYGRKIRHLHFIGHRTSDWMDVIAVRKEEVIRTALEYLERCQHLWDYLDLHGIDGESDTLVTLSHLTHRIGFSFQKEPAGVCPYVITIPDWESYYKTHARKRVSGDPERQIRRLRTRGELKVEWPNASNLRAHLEALFDLHQRRQAARHQWSMFSKERYRHFYRDLARTLPLNYLDCPTLQLNGKTIAAHFGFRYNHKLYFLTPAFDLEYEALSPGKVLLRYMIENCFADDEVQEFDFLFGDEPYKYEWATGERRCCRALIGSVYMSGWSGEVLRRIPLRVRHPLVKIIENSFKNHVAAP